VLGVDPTTGRGAGRRDTEDIEELIEELHVELYHRLRDELRREFERLVDEYLNKNIDERTVKSIAKATAAAEVARLHNVVREELDEFKAEIEERLSSLGLDRETINQVINEVVNKLLSDLDRRFMHLASVIDERFGEVRDLLDLTSEILRIEIETEEELDRLKSLLDEERIEEYLYRVLVRKGILKRRRRKWVPLIVGLGILAAIVTGLLLSPIVTLVILFIVFVVLMRW
jgi:hypothetical protein